ncbi:MAG: tRNA (adenosine(37)-N6)-dimethylallyltransferase MiaA [candidate division Zixibacteria bacterium]|nr:tRNA (adenosine(37)-N6)-dimethylallyltransferase MiaA [candidate division Zixibacteria bacterium]
MDASPAKKLLGLVGPTGVGKTGLAIRLCRELMGEIVSCDSRQIYRKLDIGTAKPNADEISQARHHLLDIIDIGEQFSAYRFRQMALEVIEDILKRGKVPLVVGGTGLYYRALTEGIFETPQHDDSLRGELEAEAELHGNQHLLDRLAEVDPRTAKKLSVADRFRIIRALEIYHLTGKTKSELSAEGDYPEKTYNFVTVGLNLKRKKLYERINKRVLKMFEEGWYEETRELIEKSVINSGNYSKLMGYNTIYEVIADDRDRSEMIAKIQQAHRNYAKRQLTWFKRVRGIRWVSADDPDAFQKIMEVYNDE